MRYLNSIYYLTATTNTNRLILQNLYFQRIIQQFFTIIFQTFSEHKISVIKPIYNECQNQDNNQQFFHLFKENFKRQNASGTQMNLSKMIVSNIKLRQKSSWKQILKIQLQFVILKTIMQEIQTIPAITQQRINIFDKFNNQSHQIEEYLCINQQTQLLQAIRDQIVKKKYLSDASLFVQNLENHSFGYYKHKSQTQKSLPSNIDEDMSISLKSKFTEEFEETLLQIALSEIKQQCSKQTYETVKKACQTNRALDYSSLQKLYEKIKKENQEVKTTNLSLHKEKSSIIWELNLLKPKIQNLDEQKAKIKKLTDQLMAKQAKLFKIEASFAFKDKINLQGAKRYQRQRQSAIIAQRQLRQTVKAFQCIWASIQQKCSTLDCPQQCWKKDVMKKCKQKLIEHRNLLKDQQQQIQKQYQIMATLSTQFKKLFANNENNNASKASICL